MGHHHHITWLSHSYLVEFSVLICPARATGKDDSEGCCKVAVFLGTCTSMLEVEESGHSSKPDLSSLTSSAAYHFYK